MPIKPVIYWFRNDLRLHDNPAQYHAVQSGRPVIPVFIFDNTRDQEFPGLINRQRAEPNPLRKYF
ncbi:deoxyribodipyrimidine photo-lyase [Thermophagus xiamenensis]|uniref:deoxyribodipyrimidine photo-lyase n=1 Tax=Thermophagus xiamenensis TaxID=385682 RepID=UPI000255D460|nr:deoxyribodipyrimidine photo-lyase [Thermophagus xiamenensis]